MASGLAFLLGCSSHGRVRKDVAMADVEPGHFEAGDDAGDLAGIHGRSVLAACGAVDGPTAIFQTRKWLKDEARPTLHFGRAFLKKSWIDFFSILLGAEFVRLRRASRRRSDETLAGREPHDAAARVRAAEQTKRILARFDLEVGPNLSVVARSSSCICTW